jgi:hypothetical protein
MKRVLRRQLGKPSMSNQAPAITAAGDGAAKAASQVPTTRQHIELRIGGMTCTHCPPDMFRGRLIVE